MGACVGFTRKEVNYTEVEEEEEETLCTVPLLSISPRPSLPTHSEIIRAAWIIEDALEGRPADRYPKDVAIIELRRISSRQQRYKQIFDVVVIAWVGLLFFETPLWCLPDHAPRKFLANKERCPLPHDAEAVTAGLPMLPPDYGILLELLCLVSTTLFFLLEMRWIKIMTRGGFTGIRNRGPRTDIFLLILAIAWVDLAFFNVTRQTNFRLSSYCRLALLFYQRPVRNVFRSALKCCSEFNNIAFFMIAAVVFFTWLLAMILDDITESDGKRAMEEIGGDGFGSFSAGLLSFFTIMTGAAFPDTIIPLIDNMRMLVFIFIFFMLLTFFLFTQLMLAVVYNAYQDDLKQQLQEDHTCRSRGLAMAFRCMAKLGLKSPKVMQLGTFKQIISSLAQFPTMSKHLSMDGMDVLCDALDDNSGELSFHEFHVACDILLYRFWTSPKNSLLQTWFGWHLPWVRKFIGTGGLDAAVNCTLAFNMIFIVYESMLEMDDAPEPAWVQPVETFFSCIYVVEVMLKLSVTSFEHYWSRSSDQFDFIVSWLLFLVGVCVALPFINSGSLHDYLPYLNILRMLRLLKLLERTRHFKMMSNCVRNLVRVSEEMCFLLVVTWLLFATIGVHSFGGKLYPTNPVLVDTDFVSNGYYVLNFHDLGSAVLATFCMMVATYMPEYAEAMNLVVTWLPMFGVAYCALFFFIGVNIVFNIFTAFTIDVFITLKTAEEKELFKESQTHSPQMKQSWIKRFGTTFLNDPGDTDEALLASADTTPACTPRSSLVLHTEDLREEDLLEAMHAVIRPGQNRVLHVVLPPKVIRARTLLDVFDDLGSIVSQARKDHASSIVEDGPEPVDSFKFDGSDEVPW